MHFPFARKQQYIPDKKLELFVEDTPKSRRYLIIIPVAFLVIVAVMAWYKKHLDQDNEMQEALTSQSESFHPLMLQANAAGNGSLRRAQQGLPAPKAQEVKDTGSAQDDKAAQQARNKQAVESAVIDWKRAWESSDVEAYLNHYAADFTPDDGSSLQQWKAVRSDRLNSARNIEISLSNLDIRFESADTAKVAFDQEYHSKTFTDTTHKVLLVRQQEGEWKIAQELAD